VRNDRRLPEQIEVAAYYVASEALTNAAKHAKASVVDLRLECADYRAHTVGSRRRDRRC
jgi:signal transduction histidine kinase